jgi:hypothetical protein
VGVAAFSVFCGSSLVDADGGGVASFTGSVTAFFDELARLAEALPLAEDFFCLRDLVEGGGTGPVGGGLCIDVVEENGARRES